MGKKAIGMIGIIYFFIMAGCTYNVTDHISPLLDPNFLNDKTGGTKTNLAETGQCPAGTLPLNPVNIETRTEKYVVYDENDTMYIVPKDFIEYTVKYMKLILLESNLTVDNQSENKILVSLQEAASSGIWPYKTNVKFKIELPEINYSHVYSGSESSPVQHNSTAYALHLAIIEFLNDPVFQKYVQCR